MDLSQEKAEEYMNARKKFIFPKKLNLNQPFSITEKLISDLHGDIFKLDLKQGRIELNICNINHRANEMFTLCRLDIGSDLVHKNPDGKKIVGSHIHFYKEGFNDKFAFPAEEKGFEEPLNILKSIRKFFDVCNIDKSKISIQERL